MSKKTIRLSENQLRKLIKGIRNQILNEGLPALKWSEEHYNDDDGSGRKQGGPPSRVEVTVEWDVSEDNLGKNRTIDKMMRVEAALILGPLDKETQSNIENFEQDIGSLAFKGQLFGLRNAFKPLNPEIRYLGEKFLGFINNETSRARLISVLEAKSGEDNIEYIRQETEALVEGAELKNSQITVTAAPNKSKGDRILGWDMTADHSEPEPETKNVWISLQYKNVLPPLKTAKRIMDNLQSFADEENMDENGARIDVDSIMPNSLPEKMNSDLQRFTIFFKDESSLSSEEIGKKIKEYFKLSGWREGQIYVGWGEVPLNQKPEYQWQDVFDHVVRLKNESVYRNLIKKYYN
jgi:hypothetical protein